MRKNLKKNENLIHLQDYGKGSKQDSNNDRTVASIANTSLSFPYQCRVMFRMVEHLKPKTILELGTSLGISTSYLASASLGSTVHTLEGDPQCLSIAQQVFESLKLKNIQTVLGPFSETLEAKLQKLKEVDLVFMDGHHDEKATLSYYGQISKYCSDNSVIIVDDIYWSEGMQRAWHEIIKKKNVKLSIDLHFCGIVFFRSENKEKEHFKIRPDKLLYFR